jgi:glycosyltransferase XagB
MRHGGGWYVLLGLFVIVQVLYFLSLAVNAYFYSRSIDWISPDDVAREDLSSPPPVLLLYPVLNEAEETMRTTLLTIAAAREDYGAGVARVVALPNDSDLVTIASIRRLMAEFTFLELLTVPPTSHPSWVPVWSDWDSNSKAYWWHIGKRQGEMNLPAKKTRQLIFALYAFAANLPGDRWLLSYLDADSAVPTNYFRIAAAGSRKYDVVQLTNVAGNLNDTWASTFHSMDHMAWDGAMYPHMTAGGKHPFYVLGKGLFYRVADLVEVGGFHPWLTIEDPEVGMRLWTNGKRLGVSDVPLIEEVPQTFRGGITQRKRWVAGFFQSLHTPLTLMGMTFTQRMKARLNFVPCLALGINVIGFPLSIWALVETLEGNQPLDRVLTALSVVNIVGALATLTRMYWAAWVRSGLVLDRRRDRLKFMLRVNPVLLILYWALWLVPLAIGFTMFIRDTGLTWQRTEKIDANHNLVRSDRDYVGAAMAAAPAIGRVIYLADRAHKSEPHVGRHRKQASNR